MDNKTYNVCLKVARLCCGAVAFELARVNGLTDLSGIHIQVTNNDLLVKATFAAMRGTRSPRMEADLGKALSVSSDQTLAHSVNIPKVYVQAAGLCGDARVCQKHYMDLAAAEEYLRAAYDYDIAKRTNKATIAARKVVASLHSEKFLQEFVPYGRPQIDPNVKAQLRRRAFDPLYSYTKEPAVIMMAQKRMRSVLAARSGFFLKPDGPAMPHMAAVVNPGGHVQAKRPLPVSLKNQQDSVMDIGLLQQLYNGEFADLPVNGRRRRFVNLPARCRDLMDCPKRMLNTKKRFLEIESMTKHGYIYGYYNDGVRGAMTAENLVDYYMQKEAEMYQQIWHTDKAIYFDGRQVTFPDGTALPVPAGEDPSVFMHRVNIIYAAMFGFTPDDMQGGDKWLENSVRCAYTDEGMADYRLAVVAARLDGRLK